MCHNVEKAVTLYVNHIIEGESIRGAVKCSDRKGFTRGPKALYKGFEPNEVFSKVCIMLAVYSFSTLIYVGRFQQYL